MVLIRKSALVCFTQAEDKLTFELSRVNGAQRELQKEVSQLQKETEKQQRRLTSKEEVLTAQTKELAAMRSRWACSRDGLLKLC